MTATLLVACSSGGGPRTTTAPPTSRPSSTAGLRILEPKNGAVITGTDVPVRVALTGARIVPATTTNLAPDRGHLHISIDNQVVRMNFTLTGEIPDVPPGMHVLRVEFVASDHAPFDPRIFSDVTFQVRP